MLKIAVPTQGQQIDNHFGHCETYSIFTIDENKQISKKEIIPSPQGCGCKSNIASTLAQIGVTIMLAGNMGNGALNVLTNHHIKVFRGVTGNVNEAISAYLKGSIMDSGIGCSHHEQDDHQCNH